MTKSFKKIMMKIGNFNYTFIKNEILKNKSNSIIPINITTKLLEHCLELYNDSFREKNNNELSSSEDNIIVVAITFLLYSIGINKIFLRYFSKYELDCSKYIKE